MVSPVALITAIFLYMAFLFLVALWAERTGTGRNLVKNRVVYSLGLTVLFTSWTFYGSVGRAANIGMMFFVLYIGTIIPLFFWWIIVRKMVRLKNKYRITSIADFISTRYNKSSRIGALVTVFSLVGVMPYIALQLKGIITTFEIMTGAGSGTGMNWITQHAGLVVTFLMIAFTIVFGVRKLDPTERHPGIAMAVAVDAVFKLTAFLAAGLFVLFYVFDGPVDLFSRAASLPFEGALDIPRNDPVTFSVWVAYLFISSAAIMFLPRQFHMTVVENSNEKHIRTAMWFLPAYTFLITLLCYPVALGGLLIGLPLEKADSFVLMMPFNAGETWLSLFVFLGGFAASTGMVMICAMTLSTMFTNHMVLPLIEWIGPLGFLRRYLLQFRWLAVAMAILIGYFFERTVGGLFMLVNMGVLSFAAVAQFTPAILGGLFWRAGNKAGALTGISLGFAVWFYTMILPAFARAGWISVSIVDSGPWGIGLLRPEQLMGLTGFHPIANSVFWSLFFNAAGYVIVSMLLSAKPEEERLANDFVDALRERQPIGSGQRHESVIDLREKQLRIDQLLTEYFFPEKARSVSEKCFERTGLHGLRKITLLQLAALHDEVEKVLSGVVGSAAARKAMKRSNIFSRDEEEQLSATYAEILSRLKISPEELERRIDYYQEREELLQAHAQELEAKIRDLDHEIRERTRVESDLKRTEEKYRGIFENAVDGIFQTNLGGRFISANQALAGMIGYDSPKQLIESITDIGVQLYETPRDREVFMEILMQERNTAVYETRFLRRDGSAFWVSLHARPVFNPDGRLLYIEGICQDITYRKEAEREKAHLEEQLRQSQKMEALGKLSGGIAHDFNNLLHAISGYVQLLLMKKNDGDRDLNYLSEIDRAVSRASAIVQRLLTFSRKMETHFEAVNLNRVVDESLHLLRHTLPKNLTIETDLEEELAEIQADPTQLEQVLMNLAGNAGEAMPDGGRLTIETRMITLGNEHRERYPDLNPGDYVKLSVMDTGHGMDEEILQRIFEPFFTTKEVGKGTGLGLSIVYGILKSHNGHITCNSEPGQGTTFRLYLPVGENKENGKPGPLDEHETKKGLGQTILIVDDEEAILEIADEVLTDHGYRVIRAQSGEEALEWYSGNNGIDLVILDLGMPGIGGERCLEKLLEMDPLVRVIVASGYGGHDMVEDPSRFGASAFIGKPYSLTHLLAEIHRILGNPS